MKHLLCFGFGFSAEALARKLDPLEWRVTGTSRSPEGVAAIHAHWLCYFRQRDKNWSDKGGGQCRDHPWPKILYLGR